jgi:hypothetical protein
MSDNDDEIERNVGSWIGSQAVDSIADYAGRGRKYRKHSDEELSSAWVQTFKASARDIHNKELRATQADYFAELSLRGLNPPFALVHDDMKLMTCNIKAWIAGLTAEELTSLGERIDDDFSVFQDKRDTEQN